MPRFRPPVGGGAAAADTPETDQIYFMRRESVNGVCALFGLVLALLVLARIRGWGCMARYHHQPRKGTLASLLNNMIQVLFVLNAVYAFGFLVVAIVEMAVLSRNEELAPWDPGAPMEDWAYTYNCLAHVLAQLSLLPQFWHCCLAWLFYAYIVQGRTAAALERVVRERVSWYWLGAVVGAAGVSAMCFYAPSKSALHRAELPWTAATTATSLLIVFGLYLKTMIYWRWGSSGSNSSTNSKPALGRSTTLTAGVGAGQQQGPPQLRSQPGPPASATLRKPLWRLMALLGFFLAIGTWALVNECRAAVAALKGQRGPRSTGDMPNVVLTVVDALILGNVLSCIYPACLQSDNRRKRKQQRALNQRRQQLLMDQQRRRGAAAERGNKGSNNTGGGSSGGLGLKLSSMSLLRKRSQGSDSLNSGVVLRPRGRLDRQLQIFASTFNAGSTKACASLGPMDAWIPVGFDLYIIGIQECMVYDELAVAIHRRLGGPGQYVACTDSVWSTNGEIGLLIFARAEDAASGAFEVLGGLANKVNLGASVGVGNLPNKAAVGLACRLHDRTLALVTAHFAADKHGRERPEARARDAVRSLKELRLGGECEEVDLQNAFHHTIVLGDLNWRVRLPPNCVVERLAASVGEEKRALARLLLPGGDDGHPPLPSLVAVPSSTASANSADGSHNDFSSGISAAGSASSLARSTRLARYQTAVPGLPTPPPFGSNVSLVRFSSVEAMEAAAVALARMEEGELPSSSTASSHGTGDGMDLGDEEMKQEGSLGPSRPPSMGIDVTGYYQHRCPVGGEEGECEDEEAEAEARRLREWWRWVEEHDELQRVMQAGACFHGFVEGPILFPPSFRWVRGARADYAKDGVAAFDGCYTLVKASEGTKGLRPPSYTDRVLVHSLPDLADDLAIEEYDVCEAMVGSDHRPVAAALRLTVDASPSASLNKQARRSGSSDAVKTRKLVVSFSDVRFVPLAVPPTTPVAAQHQSQHEGEAEAEGPAVAPAPLARTSTLGGLQRLGSYLPGIGGWKANGTGGEEQGPVALPAAQCLSSLIVHYPLLLEDPAALAAQRKAEELKAGLEQGFAMGRRERRREKEAKQAEAVAAILDSEEGSNDLEAGGARRAAGGPSGASESGSGAMCKGLQHLENVHTLSFKGGAGAAAEGGGGGHHANGGNHHHALSFRVAVHERVPSGDDTGTGLPHYAVVRVRDKRKHEIGQSILCLREALPHRQRERKPPPRAGEEDEEDEEDESEGEQEERGAVLEASVCDGGRLVGRLLLRAEVLTEEEERRRRKKELQKRAGFLASATATIRGMVGGGGGGGVAVDAGVGHGDAR